MSNGLGTIRDVWCRLFHRLSAAYFEGKWELCLDCGHGEEESLHVELPPGTEHGSGFSASDLKGMTPIEGMIHYGRTHGGRLDPKEAAIFFAMAMSFGVSSEALVEQKLRQLLTVGAAQKFFQQAVGGAFELRKRSAA